MTNLFTPQVRINVIRFFCTYTLSKKTMRNVIVESTWKYATTSSSVVVSVTSTEVVSAIDVNVSNQLLGVNGALHKNVLP